MAETHRTVLATNREYRHDRKYKTWEYTWYSDGTVKILKFGDVDEEDDFDIEKSERQFEKLSKRARKALERDRTRREKSIEFLKKIGKLP